jgi:hypothetical protein
MIDWKEPSVSLVSQTSRFPVHGLGVEGDGMITERPYLGY